MKIEDHIDQTCFLSKYFMTFPKIQFNNTYYTIIRIISFFIHKDLPEHNVLTFSCKKNLNFLYLLRLVICHFVENLFKI
jgi:hypothetical protein